ncbi:MAG: hypothetical protein HN576_06750 [Bacteriovoracaceae bacterium]|nr:hypothetical protein [Bacteriovoracaceae bacterium]
MITNTDKLVTIGYGSRHRYTLDQINKKTNKNSIADYLSNDKESFFFKNGHYYRKNLLYDDDRGSAVSDSVIPNEISTYSNKLFKHTDKKGEVYYSPFEHDIRELDRDEIEKFYTKMFKEAADDLKAGKNVVLSFSGHGEIDMSAMGSGIQNSGQGLEGKNHIIIARRMGELMKKAGLDKQGPPFIRVVGLHCKAGAYHSLIEEFSNTCVASFSDYRKNVPAQYNMGPRFFKYIEDMKTRTGTTPSLQEAWSASYLDSNHAGIGSKLGGQMSSTHYIRTVLSGDKNGTFDKEKDNAVNKRFQSNQGRYGKVATLFKPNKSNFDICDEIKINNIAYSSSSLSDIEKVLTASSRIPKNYSESFKYYKAYKGKEDLLKENVKMTRVAMDKLWGNIKDIDTKITLNQYMRASDQQRKKHLEQNPSLQDFINKYQKFIDSKNKYTQYVRRLAPLSQYNFS